MSIILDALKRAENLRKKNQPPTLMGGSATNPRTNYRVMVLASVFVAAGLGAWFVRPSTTATPTALADEKVQVELGGTAAPPTESNTPAGIIEERPLITDAPVQPVQLVTTTGAAPALRQPFTHSATLERSTAQATQLSVPTLAQPLTQPAIMYAEQAAQQEKLRAQQAAAMAAVNQPPLEPVNSPTPIAAEPMAAKPTQQVPTSEPSLPTLPTIFELDYPVRLALPKMLVSMYVYNSNPEFRFLIVNGKKVRQGEQVEASVTFAEIRRDGVECEYQGTRFFFPRASQ